MSQNLTAYSYTFEVALNDIHSLFVNEGIKYINKRNQTGKALKNKTWPWWMWYQAALLVWIHQGLYITFVFILLGHLCIYMPYLSQQSTLSVHPFSILLHLRTTSFHCFRKPEAFPNTLIRMFWPSHVIGKFSLNTKSQLSDEVANHHCILLNHILSRFLITYHNPVLHLTQNSFMILSCYTHCWLLFHFQYL